MKNHELKQTRDALKQVRSRARALSRSFIQKNKAFDAQQKKLREELDAAFIAENNALQNEETRLETRLATLTGRAAK